MEKPIQIKLNKKTYKCDSRFRLIKGISYKDAILGERINIEKYVEVNDFLVIKKQYFNKEYKFKVITINSDKNDNIIATIQNEEFIEKSIMGSIKKFIVSDKKETY